MRHGRAESPDRTDAGLPSASFTSAQRPSGASAHDTSDHRARLRELLAQALPAAAPESIAQLAAAARLKTVGCREVIFRQGEPIPLTLVVRGYALFRRTTPEGRELVFGVARPGWVFGYSGIGGQASSVDLVSATPTKVGLWSGSDLRELLATDRGLALSVVDAMGRYIVLISERFDGFIHQEARGRVLRALAENGDLLFGEPPVLPRTLLPGLVGTSREMTGRVLRVLEGEGVIARMGRRGLRLLDPNALEEAVELTAKAG